MLIRPDQIYSEPDGLTLRFDLFRPETDESLPLVICVHGGGWISGSKEDMRDVALRLASNGFAVACPSYRLAPLHPYPAAVEDLQTLVCRARSNADEWKIDPNRIAALGNSAGGHLSCMMALTGPEDCRVNAVVDICGITDLTTPRDRHFPISWAFLEEFMGVPHEGNEELYRQASPVYHVEKGAPPFLVIHGEADDIVPIEQSRALVAELERHGVSHEFYSLPNEMHSFSFLSWARIEQLFIDFLTNRFSHAYR